MDVNKLLNALDDETNDRLINLTSKKLIEMNFNILKQLHLTKIDTIKILEKLKGYIYVDEINDFKNGTFLRWIPLHNPEDLKLNRGALFCEIKIVDEGTFVVCKKIGYTTSYFKINMDENLIFRKLREPELIILNALDHLS